MPKNLISIQDFSKEEILHILSVAREFEAAREQDFLRGKVVACLFFEPSTRTRLSFEAAVSRLGAQVITGLGFIGAGTIIKTGHTTVKGLTTAAGLWATGIVGLSIGAGFYEGAIAGTLAILFCESVMSKVRIRRYKTFKCIINYLKKETLDQILRYCKDRNIMIRGLQIEGERDDTGAKVYSAFVSLRPYGEVDHAEFIRKIEAFDGVINAFIQ